jgi:Protein of unknown function (DUF2752)
MATGVVAGGLAGLVLVGPAPTLPRCPVYTLTGKFCPGCGVQRAARSLVRGDLSEAVSFNALIFALPLLLLALRLARRSHDPQRSRLQIVLLAVVVTALFTVLRNRQGSRLAPHRA